MTGAGPAGSQGRDLAGWPVLDPDGAKVGSVDGVWDRQGTPRYIGVRMGRLRTTETLLPIEVVRVDEATEQVLVPWSRDQVKAAPRLDDEEGVTPELEQAVRTHFRVDEHDPGEPAAAMTRSEEELVLGVQRRAYGTARLRKWIEEEQVQQLVPLHHDVIRVEEVPVPDPELDSGQVETTPDGDLSVPVLEERLVIEKRVVVTKRLVLRRRQEVLRQELVSDTLRREQVEVWADRPDRGEAALSHASGGEDLSRGPTPQTRHPGGGADDVRDTTQGPTPETRRAARLADHGDPRAVGEPSLDRATRTDRGGQQDRLDVTPGAERLYPPPPAPQAAEDPDGGTRP